MNNQQPIIVMPEDTRRTLGRNAQRINISAAKEIADTVRTTLGSKGMDKMLVDNIGDIVVTNDGVTILEEMQIEHPAAKMMVEVAKTQETEVGDGTTTAVILAGELLSKAEELLDQKIHPTVITKGYKLARDRALKLVTGVSEKLDPADDVMLKSLATTTMTGKSAERASKHLSGVFVQAIKAVDGDFKNIKIEKRCGGSIEDTEMIEGLIVDKEIVHSGMPVLVKDAKILLLDSALEVEKTETDAQIQITSPEQMQSFLGKEESMLRNMVSKIKETGANVVFCTKAVADLAQHFLAKANIMTVRRVTKDDIQKLSQATGANLVTGLNEDIAESDLGFAGMVEENKISGDKMLFIRNCKNPKAVSILVRGGTEHVIDEITRAADDVVQGLASALEIGRVVSGGGASEIEVAKGLKEYAQSFSGREQLAIQAFAEAIESIPRTLAENAGLDPIDTIVELRAVHDKGNVHYGLDLDTGKAVDMLKSGVIESLKIKTQAIKSASEVAEMILRIDDVIMAGRLNAPPQQPGM